MTFVLKLATRTYINCELFHLAPLPQPLPHSYHPSEHPRLLLPLSNPSNPEPVDMNSESSAALLNTDIMHIIMSYATRNAVSGLMKTCHTLNSEGAQYLLRDEVSIECDAQLLSFMCFLMARNNPDDCVRRMSFFNKLSLHFDYPSPDIAILLTGIFEIIVGAGFSFTSLKVSWAEDLLRAHPLLGAAIAKLTTLKTLELSFAGAHCAALLRTLQSKLVAADITFGDTDHEDEDLPECDRNPLLLLRGSQSTLKSLSTGHSVSFLRGPRYTNVTHLSLSYISLPIVEGYIHAFPNLRIFSALECSVYRDDSEVWEDRRMTSIEYQARHGTWQSLGFYSGSMRVLWLLGLTCHVPSIKLDIEDDELELDKLNDVLHDVRPTCLVLKLPEASCLSDKGFLSALCTDTLQELDLSVSFSPEKDSTLFVGDVLVSCSRWCVIGPLSLKNCCLGFACQRCSNVLCNQCQAPSELVLCRWGGADGQRRSATPDAVRSLPPGHGCGGLRGHSFRQRCVAQKASGVRRRA